MNRNHVHYGENVTVTNKIHFRHLAAQILEDLIIMDCNKIVQFLILNITVWVDYI